MAKSVGDLLARAVPKLKDSPGKLEGLKRKLARFSARAWVKGKDKLAALGMSVPSKAHAAALEAARLSEDDDEGAFLDDVRKVLGDDAFVEFARACAKAYAKALAKKKEREAAEDQEEEEEAEAPPPPPPVAEAPGSISESGSSDGEAEELPALEVPDEDEEPAAKPLGIRMDEEEEPAPKRTTSDSLKNRKKGEFERLELVEEPPAEGEPQLEFLPVQPSPAELAKKAADAPKAPPRDEGPDAAAARSLERYKKDGDDEELANARKLYKVALEKAPAGPARASARAGLALCHLLKGQDDEAKKHAEKALAEDPTCGLAISVASRATRGEGAREKVRAGLARARAALRAGDRERAAEEANALAEAYPDEPFAALVHLALAALGTEVTDQHVAAAWKHYPSTRFPDLPLGEGLDVPAAQGAASWGQQLVDKGGTETLVATQRKLEEKDNVLAGAFQIALGVARVAIATRTADLSKREEQELRAAAAEGLLGLQYFDASAAAFDKAFAIDRNSGCAMQCKKGSERAAVFRRAFDKPGIKAKLGSFDGVGATALKKSVGARVASAMSEKESEEGTLLKDEVEAVKALAASASRRAQIEKRAKEGKLENPLGPLADIEGKLAELESESKGLTDKKDAGKGFFGRALDKVKDTAKGAQLAVKKQMFESKRDESYRAVARLLRSAPEGGWRDSVLDGLAARGSAVEAKLEFLEDELLQAKKVVARLGEL